MQKQPYSKTTLLLDTTFLNSLGQVVRQSSAPDQRIVLGDVFQIMLELPNIKAAIIPHFVYAREIRNKALVETPDGARYETIRETKSPEIGHRLHQSGVFIQKHAHLVPSLPELQRLLDGPPARVPSKLLVVKTEEETALSAGVVAKIKHSNHKEWIDYSQRHKKGGVFEKDGGESRLVDLMRATRFGSDVYVVSDDVRSFVLSSGAHYFTSLRTADKGAKVAVCSTYVLYEWLVHNPECLEYVNWRLHQTKHLPENYQLRSHQLRDAVIASTVNPSTTRNHDEPIEAFVAQGFNSSPEAYEYASPRAIFPPAVLQSLAEIESKNTLPSIFSKGALPRRVLSYSPDAHSL